uniref:ATP synthase F0 subunit 8 n=1 Tax=Miridiba trichophora TaxID=2986799 RepID=UPI00223856F2|nr:ATP synthase F0 subunit 8 [Miridiba trichophora]UYI30128.1 ATP synthase F0 subunit 8 [Miridiba trichophora]
MPQMAPLNWLSLFMVFCLILFMFNVMNYYSIIYSPKSMQTKIKHIPTNWKW